MAQLLQGGGARPALVMRELGFVCSASDASFRALLQQCGGAASLNEQAVAEVLAMMAETQQAANIQGADQMSLASTLAIIASGGAAPGADGSAQSGWNWKVSLFSTGTAAFSGTQESLWGRSVRLPGS